MDQIEAAAKDVEESGPTRCLHKVSGSSSAFDLRFYPSPFPLTPYPLPLCAFRFALMPYDLIIEPGRAERQYWRDLWHYRELFYILARLRFVPRRGSPHAGDGRPVFPQDRKELRRCDLTSRAQRAMSKAQSVEGAMSEAQRARKATLHP